MAALAPILTDDLIDRILRRAERDVCPPGDARCCGFSSGAEHALSTLSADGWCTVGRVSAGAARYAVAAGRWRP